MGVITTKKKNALNRMNATAYQNGLGDLLNPCIVASGRFTTVGGDATESITVTDCAVGDAVIVTINTVGVTPRTVTSAVAASGAITVTMSGDPSTDHVLNYVVFRSV